MRETVLTHVVQGIAIRKLRRAQCLELRGRRMQFQLGRDDLFHGSHASRLHMICQAFHGVKLYCLRTTIFSAPFMNAGDSKKEPWLNAEVTPRVSHEASIRALDLAPGELAAFR
jgi:hypothetical protein